MNTTLFSLAIIEIIISIVMTVVIVFVSYKMLQRLFFPKETLDSQHMAFTIFTCGIVISIGLILSEIVPSITNIIRLSASQPKAIDTLKIAEYSGLYLLIGFVMAVFINLSVFLLFSVLTKGVNEFKEIKKNNIAVASLVASLLLSITFIVKDSIALLISALVPYPDVTNFLL